MQLPVTATLKEASALERQLATALASPGASLQVDASALAEFDTSILAVLMQTQRQARVNGRSLQVQHAPAKLKQLAQLYGVQGLLGLDD